MFNQLPQFTKTRLMLSGWYTVILLLILALFSVVLFIIYNNDVTRIVLEQDFGNHVPRALSNSEMRLVLAQVRELRNTSRLDIIIVDAVILLFGSGLSFFLAGKTLQPIEKILAGQKAFVADASHELKSPVTTIQSACEVVMRSTKKTKEDYQEAISLVYEQSLRLGKLISDLLSLSVLDAGSTKPLEKCSLTNVVEKEIETIQPLMKKAGITVEKNINPDVFALGDKDKLQQLVVILLDNAIKYTQKKGKIKVKVINKPIPQLIVEDTGIGIAHEKQKDIFRRFYQADSSHAEKGAGLGLSIAQSIMKLHKGKITVISQPGMGSAFTCTFPNNA